jgi:hypothetical protein
VAISKEYRVVLQRKAWNRPFVRDKEASNAGHYYSHKQPTSEKTSPFFLASFKYALSSPTGFEQQQSSAVFKPCLISQFSFILYYTETKTKQKHSLFISIQFHYFLTIINCANYLKIE